MAKHRIIEKLLLIAAIGCLFAAGFTFWQDKQNEEPEGLAFDIKGDGQVDAGSVPPGEKIVYVTLTNRTKKDRKVMGINFA
jgi:hypothetical protein